jgi:serine/threonine protein kinase
MAQRAREYQSGERLPGTVYEVVRLIGAGGMGTVYDVVDTTIGKRYVLKTLHPQLGTRDDLARRMQKEARTLGRLNHTNIVEVITAGVSGDELRLPYYVMERLNGQSLRLVLEKKGQLELPHAYQIGIDLLDALDHAHGEGVIHRDVKPDNIFLHRTLAGMTVTKLIDFGIQSLIDATTRETAGRFVGTLRYAAPEQLRGEPATPKVDIYAAGLVLYEMIAGRGPFDDEVEPHAIGAAHMHLPAPALSAFVDVPREIEDLVMAALAKSAEARPADAFSFASSLRNLKRALPGPRARESTEERATAAVIGSVSAMASYVHVRQPSADGPYVISPARAPAVAARARLPQTTLQGVTQPTLGPPLATSVVDASTVTTPEPVDRMAETNSFAPHTMVAPRYGTEQLDPVPHFATELSPQDGEGQFPRSAPDSPFHWPDERASAMSEEPQVRTLSVVAPTPSRAWLRAVAVVALLSATVGAGVVALRHSASRRIAGAVTPPAAIAQPAPLPASSPTFAAAPSAAPERPVSSATPAASSSAAPVARRKPRPAPSGSSSKAAIPEMRTDRPGPGF